ncbi:MAG TPA: aspartyl/asparaginyl beta-hydroxylase domain-containing protein [Verrucomicrobiae bacterium]|nr:aspartyl/asparaginyl beta-hydroxylase domain-containing protein [Verrucomicrobiae bacterium]
MKNFTLIAEGVDVAPLLAELDAHPELWNENPGRLMGVGPHRETSDIWVRYRAREELREPEDYRTEHRSVWYPAAEILPSMRRTVIAMIAPILAESPRLRLGGVLMTKIPAGRNVYPHHDLGTWHSEYYTTKLWMPLRANDQCFNTSEDETVVMRPGSVWTFNNLLVHSVHNQGDTERIALIVCTRRL